MMKRSKLLNLVLPLALTSTTLQASGLILRGRHPLALDRFFSETRFQLVVGGGLHAPFKHPQSDWSGCLPSIGLRWRQQFEGGALWDGLHKPYENWKEALVQGSKGYFAGSFWEHRVHGVVLVQNLLRDWGVQTQAELLKGRLWGLKGRLGLQANLMLTEWPLGEGLWGKLKEVIRIEGVVGLVKGSFGLGEQGLQVGVSWQGEGLPACPLEAAQQLVSHRDTLSSSKDEDEIGKENAAPEMNRKVLKVLVASPEQKGLKAEVQATKATYSGASTAETLMGVEGGASLGNASEDQMVAISKTLQPLNQVKSPQIKGSSVSTTEVARNQFAWAFEKLSFTEKIYRLDEHCLSQFLSIEILEKALGPHDPFPKLYLNDRQKNFLKKQGFSEEEIRDARVQENHYRRAGDQVSKNLLRSLLLKKENCCNSYRLIIENFSETKEAEEIANKIENHKPSPEKVEEEVCWEFFCEVLQKSPFDTSKGGLSEIVLLLRVLATFRYAQKNVQILFDKKLDCSRALIGSHGL